MVTGVGGIEGGGSEVGTARLVKLVAITHSMWVRKRRKNKTRWASNDEFSIPILNSENLQNQTRNHQDRVGPSFHLRYLSQ